jgi:hypothetical protein
MDNRISRGKPPLYPQYQERNKLPKSSSDAPPQPERGRDKPPKPSSNHPARDSNLRFYPEARSQYHQRGSSSDAPHQSEEHEEIFHLELDDHDQRPLSPVRDKPISKADIEQSQSWQSEAVQDLLYHLHYNTKNYTKRRNLIEVILDKYHDQMSELKESDIDQKLNIVYNFLRKMYLRRQPSKR